MSNIFKNKKTNVICYFNKPKLSTAPIETIPYWKLYTNSEGHFINDACNYFTYQEVLNIVKSQRNMRFRAQPRPYRGQLAQYKIEVYQLFDDGTKAQYKLYVNNLSRAELDFKQIQISDATNKVFLFDICNQRLLQSWEFIINNK